jgi:signal transduction histidine kinase
LGSPAQADVTLLEQAVSNLAHNAVRYGDAGGHVAIVLRSDSATVEAEPDTVTQRAFRRSEFGGLEAEPCRA